eukprot:PITA_05415
MAFDSLENYMDQRRGGRLEEVFYKTTSLIVPRFVEVLINLVLTGCFKVDGFCSALLVRRAISHAISHYIVDSKGNGFCANVFLTSVVVKITIDNTSVCQVLRFRGSTLLNLRTLSSIVGCINLICSVTWLVLAALECGVGKLYKINSIPPSKPKVVAIITVICIGMASAILGALGTKGFGTWHYSALQALVWVKWGIGCYLLGEYSPEYVHRPSRSTMMRSGVESLAYSSARWIDNGILVYSSTFLFNALLSALRGMRA